uniref:Uncharacterized protein n=1 Tax=Anguilla anguilla TaxID=7936 RepID=A0A0E9TMM0_ANGAN
MEFVVKTMEISLNVFINMHCFYLLWDMCLISL